MNNGGEDMSNKNKLIAVSAAVILLLAIVIIKAGFMIHSKNVWKNDINYLQNKLTTNEFELISSDTEKNKFNKQLNDFKKDIWHLDDNEIEMRLSQIVASLGEAHTVFGQLGNANMIYPVGTSQFDEGLFVIQTDKKYEQILGTKLVMINNIKIKDIASKIDTLIPHENEQWLKYLESSFLTNPSVLKYFKIANGKDAVFTFTDLNNKTFNVKISPVNLNSINISSLMNKMKNTPLRLEGNDFYWYKFLPESKLFYFQYNICEDKEQLLKMCPNDSTINELPSLNDVSDEIHKLAKANKITKVVVDMRFNTGGDSEPGANFACSLEDLKNYNIKFYVIVSKKTFSSAVLNTINMKEMLNAEIVGEDTGGSPNSYGDIKSNKLPNSGIEFTYCTKYFTCPLYKNTVTPDIKVKNSIYDYMNGTDSAVDTIVKK